MTTWARAGAETVGETVPENLRRGDLVFVRKPGTTLHRLNAIAGEPWRHVGAVTVSDAGERCVVEVNGNKFTHRTFREFFTCYPDYAAARLDISAGCIQQATDWMDERVGSPHQYAWDDLILAGLIAATMRGVPAALRSRAIAAIQHAADHAKPHLLSDGHDALTCSAFVARAYLLAGDTCRLGFRLWRRTTWPPQTVSLAELADASDEVWDQLMGEASILDMADSASGQPRRMGDTKPTAGQLEECVRTVVHAIGGMASGEAAFERITSDGRWVTPGQIWESPSIAAGNRWSVDVTEYANG